MPTRTPPSLEANGKLVENLLFFARALRAAGLPVGPGKVLAAIEAVRAVGLTRRDDFYWALHAVLVDRRDQRELFDQTFHVFWRNPQILGRMMGLPLPDLRPAAERSPEGAVEWSRRLAEALGAGDADGELGGRQDEDQVEIDAAFTWSNRETLNAMDFEKMSAEELTEARKAIERMRLPIVEVPTRRFRPDPAGRRADLRAAMRAALRAGSDTIPLRWKRHRRRHPPLVVLCDISGSMGRYSRMLLHFLHAITNDRDRVHSFLFGTRLTNITRSLRHRDVDVAMDKVTAAVFDWSGGTRIGACLREFNVDWSRRVLGQGAVVLLITDGLDRENARGLEREMERLHKSCRRLIWLNPLLRYEGYEPRSQGARAMMPHIDEFRPVHNLASLAELTDVLSRPVVRRQDGLTVWLNAP
jgi:uncharacterized protein with von Willebrand factor type A (vWA) domain